MATYYKKGNCPSTLSLDIQHVSRLGCTQPRHDKMFPHHQIWKKKRKNFMKCLQELDFCTRSLVKKTVKSDKKSMQAFWLTHRGQTHSWPQRDLGQCFHGKTGTGRREAHCISRWHPAHIHSEYSMIWIYSTSTETYSKTNTAAVFEHTRTFTVHSELKIYFF